MRRLSKLTAHSSSVGQKATTDDDAARAAVEEEKDNPVLENSELENKTVTKEAEVNPAVEHETIKREHETKEDTVIDKERHQHHYHTSVQPLKDREVLPTQHDEEVAPLKVQEFDHDDGKNIPADVDARNAEFQSKTEEGQTFESTTQTEKVAGDQVHHHLHETIQPVVEKGTDLLTRGLRTLIANDAA